jgi:hypothetical protein
MMRSLSSAILCGFLLAMSAAAAMSAPVQASFPGRDPALQWDSAGNLHALYVDEQNGEAAVWYRRLGASPAGPVRVSPPGMKVAAREETPPVLGLLPGGVLVAAYPAALTGPWKHEIRVQRSTDGGISWSAGRLPHPDHLGPHSLLSGAVTHAGLLVLAWLDDSSGHMGLQVATSADGLTFSPRQTIDASTCECCGTALLAGREGMLWLAYRDLEENDLRDFHVLRSAASSPKFDAGAKLSSDGWRLKGCPDTGARLTEAGDGTLWAAWFTAGGQPGVYVTSSKDKGAHFAPRTSLTPATVRHPEAGLLPGDRVAVLYESVEAPGAHPILARLRDPATGAWSPARPVAPQGLYPRLATTGERAALAFTCRTGEKKNVVIADWSLAEKGDLGWAGCDRDAAPEAAHH